MRDESITALIDVLSIIDKRLSTIEDMLPVLSNVSLTTALLAEHLIPPEEAKVVFESLQRARHEKN